MVLTLFNLENSRSFRVHWLINELQAPVEVRHYARVEGKKAVPEMARDSGFKLGKSPVLVEDGTGTGGGSGKYTVSESGNCLMYLAERFAPESPVLPSPSDFAQRTRVIGLVEFAESIMTHALPPVYAEWHLSDINAVEAMKKGCAPNIHNDLDELERTLAESSGAYMCGKDLTIADMALGFTVEYIFSKQIGNKGRDETRWPRVSAWLREIEGRPAYQKTRREGAKYDFCLN